MARKNLLTSVTGPELSQADSEARSEYARRGASRSMMLSIDEMAENAKKMIAGEAIIQIDASLVDDSFFTDRLEQDDEDYRQLREAIKIHGQSTPILVRPHPEHDSRYMIVFGHRRARVAKELGVPLNAVVKNMADIAHIIAQGQENTARANLSFIEKALFGKKLLDMGQSKDTIRAALTVDETLLSRMLSVAESVPMPVIAAIGAAKAVGRDRWEELKKLVSSRSIAEVACKCVQSPEFEAMDVANRFNHLLAVLKGAEKRSKAAVRPPSKAQSWVPEDNLVAANIHKTSKAFTLSLRSKYASEFGEFISSNLESLYRVFKETKTRNQTGD